MRLIAWTIGIALSSAGYAILASMDMHLLVAVALVAAAIPFYLVASEMDD